MEAILGRLSRDDLQACTQLLAKLDRQSKRAEYSDPWITLDDLVSRLSSTAAVPA
jgi:DNA polymerase III delta subunit